MLTIASTSVWADLTWNFAYSGYSPYYGNMDVSGILVTTTTPVPLTGTDWGGNVTSLTGYQIVSMSGQRNGVPIIGVINNPNFPGDTLSYALGYVYDNALVAGTPALDVYGLVYTTKHDWYSVSSMNNPDGGGYAESTDGDWHIGVLDSLTITQVIPEPTTLIAGAMLLLPFGLSTLRILGKTRAA